VRAAILGEKPFRGTLAGALVSVTRAGLLVVVKAPPRGARAQN